MKYVHAYIMQRTENLSGLSAAYIPVLKMHSHKYQPLSITHSIDSLCSSLLLQVEYFYGSWGKTVGSELNSKLEILPNPCCQSVLYRGFSL